MSTIKPYAEIPFEESELLQTVGDRFLKVIKALPAGHLAYVDNQTQISYQKLFDSSKALAAQLRILIPQGDEHQQHLIGLLLDPDWRELQSLLGVAFAGHYYMSLDASLSENQNQKLMRDYPFSVLVTTAKYRGISARLVKDRPECKLVFLDEIMDDGEEVRIPPIGYKAYQSLCFSSGSTGQPRSVIRTHGAALISSFTAATQLQINPSDRITLTSSIAIGMSTTPTIGSLLTGATIYRRMDALISPSAYYEWLKADRITIARASAGLLRSLANLPNNVPPLEDLRMIDTGGESFTRQEIDDLLGLMPKGGKLNVRLASNEAGNYALFTVSAGDAWHGDKNPAGYAPPLIKVFTVDENRNPQQAGESGEIAVRSKFLSAGYFNDPEQTKARFVPGLDDDEEFIYYTGDMGKISPEGLIEFFGRKDFRFKIRGYTVELEAVDAALRQITGVSASATAVQDLPSGNKRLVGYFIEEKGFNLSTVDVRQNLKQLLPGYMIPSVILKVDSLPLTPSGKIDRKALPLPPVTRPELKTLYREPQTDIEVMIASIWEKILDISPIGIDDSFFELGGDSLMSMQMIIEIEQVYGCTITEEVFKNPTIANIEAFIISQSDDTFESSSTANVAREIQRRGKTNQKKSIKKLIFKLFNFANIFYSVVIHLRKPLMSKFLNMGYADGLQWLLKRAKNQVITSLFFYREKHIYQNFLSSIGMDPASYQEGLGIALAGSIWKETNPRLDRNKGGEFTTALKPFWQDLKIKLNAVNPDHQDLFFNVSGFDHVQKEFQKKRGVILLSYHGNLTKVQTLLTQKWLNLPEIPVISPRYGFRKQKASNQKRFKRGKIASMVTEEQVRHGTNAILTGYRMLREGNIVRVYIDNSYLSKGKWQIEILGKQYMIRTGWADLAYQTGAAIIPAISTLDENGCINLIFLPPFQVESTDYEDQMKQYMTQYAGFLTYAFRTFPFSARWKVMQNHIGTPGAREK